MTDPDTKDCPICAETIQATATKCRHCGELLDRPSSPYAPCPICKQRLGRAVTFTWWGGLIGPKLLTHVKCGGCDAGYNGKTGKKNDDAIALYCGGGVVLIMLVMGLFGVLVMFM